MTSARMSFPQATDEWWEIKISIVHCNIDNNTMPFQLPWQPLLPKPLTIGAYKYYMAAFKFKFKFNQSTLILNENM